MRAVSAERVLDCAWPKVNHDVESFYQRLARNGKDRILALHVRLNDIGFPTKLALERSVNVTLSRLPDEEVQTLGFRIEWAAEGAAPYPRFSGWLFLRSGKNGATAVLDLEGTDNPAAASRTSPLPTVGLSSFTRFLMAKGQPGSFCGPTRERFTD